MGYADSPVFDDDIPEADAVEQLTPVDVGNDDDAALTPVRVRLSPYAEADEADLIEQAIVVPLDDDLEFDR
ncbi:hypothetical protein M1247_15630 [Mycobacterium sp. 21AC1]|uniref:hypothetical protein n=1 Tax=[Mycobacterium] appelbergii TaxID=2939269 RepID=UPI0029393FEE|nr:hypothetical protein [Mycobacterium sp. 21AC1]MDV3126352.1 hypothetical protein [Mycobacterium sp. 21AC1]